jgi:hypothetical protein
VNKLEMKNGVRRASCGPANFTVLDKSEVEPASQLIPRGFSMAEKLSARRVAWRVSATVPARLTLF